MTRAWRRRAGWIALALWVSCGAAQALVVKDYEPTGPQPSVVDEKGVRRELYKQSHALLISVSDYLGVGRKGWKPLKQTGREMDQVTEALRPHGFRVRRVSDPNGVELQSAIQSFLAEYGRDENHRLLVFFSGHGHTDRETDMGYLVPTDALDPNLNPQGFLSKALPIESLQTSAKSIRARHAVFLFDSCFSGSIFMSKALPTQPESRGASVSERFRFLTGKAAQPVRQFIAAGGPDEPLPAQSQFVPLFIQALSGSGSRVGDGYVTGKELGQWLEQTLPSYNRHQNPHSDVIKVPQLSFGDVVFQVPDTAVSPPMPKVEVPQAQSSATRGKTLLATAKLDATLGNSATGTVMFYQSGDDVLVEARVSGLKPWKEHGFHIHEIGDCSSGNGMSTGGHFNPMGQPHGPQDGAHHAGDMPNLKADATGESWVIFLLTGVSLKSGPANLMGRGIIVHAGPDDYKAQPTGNSGARIACGVIEGGKR